MNALIGFYLFVNILFSAFQIHDLKILDNPAINLQTRSTFIATSIVVDNSGVLQWTTTGESGALPFSVEQFRWNKWVVVGTVNGKGTNGQNTYSAEVSFHSGVNRFRIKQVDYTERPRYSPETTFRSLKPDVSYKIAGDRIVFSASTQYEVFNELGTLKNKGEGTIIELSALSAGKYYLHFDNICTEFIK